MVVEWSSCSGRQEREGVRDREGGVREQMQVQVQVVVVKMRSRVWSGGADAEGLRSGNSSAVLAVQCSDGVDIVCTLHLMMISYLL